MSSQSDRQYECIVYGATGYTGKYTAEHISTYLPTDFKWAVAGRSEAKLQQVVHHVKLLNADRLQPGIELAQLSKSDLVSLAQKTKILITTVGPYHKYGSLVVEACAETGTHYLDVTGEVPWHYDMVQKYNSVAKKTGAIMIPQIGIESAPPDLLSWILVSHVRQTLGVGTNELIMSLHDLKSQASGGTLATVLTLFDSYSLTDLAKSSRPWALCPVEPPQLSSSKSFSERLTGVRTISGLGTLTDSLPGPADTSIVNRSWGLIEGGKFYGPNFHFSAYMTTRNIVSGLVIHLAITLGFLSLVFPPVRWLLQRFVYQPGEGATKDEVKHDRAEWRAIAYADVADPNDPKRVYGQMSWEGSMYHLTGVCLAEAAITIARDTTLAHKLGGGMLTPATLGAPFLERLQKAGLRMEVHMMP